MSASVVDICNRALSHIANDSQIASLTEASNAARVCSLHYETVRDRMLRAHEWGFANTYATLATRPTITHPYWTTVYAYPAQCLHARRLVNANTTPTEWHQTDRVLFEVGNYIDPDTGAMERAIFTNQLQATLQFTAKVTDPARFDVGFMSALSWSLAVDIALPLSGRPATQKAAIDGANFALSLARAQDANEGTASREFEAEWIGARNS